MSEKKKNIQERKEKLKQEIRELQDELDESIHEARDDLSTRLKPRNLIREYPLTSVGITFLAGFLVGPRENDSESNKTVKRKSSAGGDSSSNGVSSHLWSEIKRSASRRAVRLLMEYLDDLIAAKSRSDDSKRRDS